jgi:hypothetical protein
MHICQRTAIFYHNCGYLAIVKIVNLRCFIYDFYSINKSETLAAISLSNVGIPYKSVLRFQAIDHQVFLTKGLRKLR